MGNKRLLYIINVDWYFLLHWLERANAAKADGWDVHLATRFTDEKNRSKLVNLGITCHFIPFSRKSLNPFNELKTILSLKKIVKAVNPDLVHCITIKPNLYGGLITQSLHIPTIKSITGLGAVFSSKKIRFRSIRRLIIYLYRRVGSENGGRLIFENEEDLQTFKKYRIAPNENMILIRGSGVSLEMFPYQTLPGSPPFKILFAARLLKDKGLQDLVEAVKLLKSKMLDITLGVAGIIDNDAVSRISEKQLLKWSEEGAIEWLGEKSNMGELLSKYNIIALPTRYGEGVPRILLEAAAVGRPLIATDTRGCRDIVIDNVTGFLVPTGNVLALAEAIEKLCLNNELCSQFGLAAHNRVKSMFLEHHVIARTLFVYNEILLRSTLVAIE